MKKIKMQYIVYYKKSLKDEWRAHGMYNKTDALGTANLCLKDGCLVKICPVEVM